MATVNVVELGGREVSKCDCCCRWEEKGEQRPKWKLKHATYCDIFETPAAVAPKAVSDAAIAAAAKQGAISAVASDDEIVNLVRRGRVTESDAMTRASLVAMAEFGDAAIAAKDVADSFKDGEDGVRARGRLATRTRPVVQLSLGKDELAALDALAAEDGRSRSAMAGRLALEEHARRHPQKRRVTSTHTGEAGHRVTSESVRGTYVPK